MWQFQAAVRDVFVRVLWQEFPMEGIVEEARRDAPDRDRTETETVLRAVQVRDNIETN